MWEFICDSTMAGEIEKQCDFILCKAKFCYIAVSLCWPFHHADAAAGCLEKGVGEARKKWPLGGLNKLLLKAPRAESHSPWAREEFPHWLHWGQSVPARAACWTRMDSAGPANARGCLLLLPKQPQGSAPQLQGSNFVKDILKRTDRSIYRGGQNSLLAQCF